MIPSNNPVSNPFTRGYQNLRVVRTLLITWEDDCPPVWRPLHSSQAHLSDDEVALFPCIFCADFALITEGQDLPQPLEDQCGTEGVVRSVVYAVVGEDLEGNAVHVGDNYSMEAAQEVVAHLRFETGHYSRSWEISSSHISELSQRFLCELVDRPASRGLLFEAFRLPASPAVGLKLIATPWSEANLQLVEGSSVAQLLQEFKAAGVPDDLVQVLQLAANADIRILVFDGDAPALNGLPIHEID
ncbi:ABC transporter substrate-binding protein [Pseudomonas aeruginosa]